MAPKKLFLFDGLGALVSAFMLGVVLVRCESFFGIPSSVLYFLAALPCGFALLDFIFYKASSAINKRGLYIIGFINIAYCVLSVALAFSHIESITSWGWAYIIVEVLIVLSLAVYEMQVAKNINNN